MPKPSDYFLSDADNAAIFEQQIRPAEFGSSHDRSGEEEGDPGGDDAMTAAPGGGGGATHGRRPVCIILAGQTGAGKSHAAPALAAALDRAYRRRSLGPGQGPGQPRKYCHLVADTHKPYHPAYAGLVADAAAGRAPPGLASAAAGHDARRWLARACAVAGAEALPTLVESASRYPRDVVEMAGIFRRAGYRVCLVLLAAHAAQSRLGLLARYLDAKAAESQEAGAAAQAAAPAEADRGKRTLPVRLTPRPIHDESYAGLAELAARLDGASDDDDPPGPPLADTVLILRRGNQVAYAKDWPAERQDDKTPPGVGAALAAERGRRQHQVAAEAALFAADVARLRARHPERAAELDALAAEYEAATGPRAGNGSDGGEEAEQPLGDLHPLDPDALVARLQSDW